MRAYMTANVVVSDESGTDVYGEASENGETLEMGWINPDYSRFVVFEDMGDVAPLSVFDPENLPESTDRDPLTAWKNYILSTELGYWHSANGVADSLEGDTFYGDDETTDWANGGYRTATYAIHFHN